VDPLADDFSAWSPYNYSYNNPFRFTDPTGRAPEECCLVSVGINVRVNTVIGSFSLEAGVAVGVSAEDGSTSFGVYSTQGGGVGPGLGVIGSAGANVYPFSSSVDDLSGTGVEGGAYLASGTGGGFSGKAAGKAGDDILSGSLSNNPSVGVDYGVGIGIAAFVELQQTQTLTIFESEGSENQRSEPSEGDTSQAAEEGFNQESRPDE
jgi:hypothetical protein